MNTFFKNIFSKISKQHIINFFVALVCIPMFGISTGILHKICGIHATLPIMAITLSLLLATKYFIVDSMANDFQKYLFKFIEEYPKKIGEIYSKKYLERQDGLLEELQNILEKNKDKDKNSS